MLGQPLLSENRMSMSTTKKIYNPPNIQTGITARIGKFVEQEGESKPRRIRLLQALNVLDPDNKYMVAWRMVNLICICIYLFELPIALVFQNTRKDRAHVGYLFQIINIPCICIFLVNMAVKMKLPFYNSGILVTDSKRILQHYFRFMFPLDVISLVAVLAYEFNQIAEQSGDVQRVISKIDLLFYVKLIEVFQTNKLNRNVVQLHRRLLATYNMVVLFTGILLISNIIACTFFFVSFSSCDNEKVSPDHISCWILTTIVGGQPIRNHDWYVQYVYSLYWATTTMLGVGYGDITPQNPYEVGFTIFAQYISCAIFAYSINEVWQIFIEMNEKQTRNQRQFNIINRYMRDRKVKSIVSNKVKAYLSHYYTSDKNGERNKEAQIIENLAPAIKGELLMDTYGNLFKLRMFQKFSDDLFQDLVLKVQERRFTEQQIIQSPQQDQEDPALYYIFKGSVSVSVMVGTKPKHVYTLNKESVFGQYEFFTLQTTQTVVTSNEYCSVYFLRHSKFRETISERDFQEFFSLKHSVLYLSDLSLLFKTCAFCGSERHLTELCCENKIRQRTYLVIKDYRTSVNTRSKFQRPPRRLVQKQFNRKQLAAITTLMNKKRADAGTESFMSQVNLNQSLHDAEPLNIGSFVQSEGSPPIYRGQSQAFETNLISKMSLRGLDDEGRFTSKKAKERVVDNVGLKKQNRQIASLINMVYHYQQTVLGQTGSIDQICNYDHYFQSYNILNAIQRTERKKGNRSSIGYRV